MTWHTVKFSEKTRSNRKEEGRDSTNQWMKRRVVKNNNSTDRQQVFSCGLWHHAHVGPGGVSAPQACAHNSACTLAANQFQQTYP